MISGREITRYDVILAIEASWCGATSAIPDDEWSEANRARGQCDASSFVAWTHLGGELVLGHVHLDGEFVEYHYWNRIDGEDLDLTFSQFRRGEVITEVSTLGAAEIEQKRPSMRQELADRIELLAARAADHLQAPPPPQAA